MRVKWKRIDGLCNEFDPIQQTNKFELFKQIEHVNCREQKRGNKKRIFVGFVILKSSYIFNIQKELCVVCCVLCSFEFRIKRTTQSIQLRENKNVLDREGQCSNIQFLQVLRKENRVYPENNKNVIFQVDNLKGKICVCMYVWGPVRSSHSFVIVRVSISKTKLNCAM